MLFVSLLCGSWGQRREKRLYLAGGVGASSDACMAQSVVWMVCVEMDKKMTRLGPLALGLAGGLPWRKHATHDVSRLLGHCVADPSVSLFSV